MSKTYIEDQVFEKVHYLEKPLEKGDYENCTFIHCDFSDADISGILFQDCTFRDCNLSMSKISNTAFRNVIFKDCKCLGMHFEYCNPFMFRISYENTNLQM